MNNLLDRDCGDPDTLLRYMTYVDMVEASEDEMLKTLLRNHRERWENRKDMSECQKDVRRLSFIRACQDWL